MHHFHTLPSKLELLRLVCGFKAEHRRLQHISSTGGPLEEAACCSWCLIEGGSCALVKEQTLGGRTFIPIVTESIGGSRAWAFVIFMYQHAIKVFVLMIFN